MATARNPITCQLIKTKHNSSEYQAGYDRIFGKKKDHPVEPVNQKESDMNTKDD